MIVNPICIDCGDTFLSTNAYHGYYCPDCHEAWLTKQRPTPRPSRPLRLTARSTSRPTRPSVTRRTPERGASRRRHGRED